jgi:hypothetical protein
MRPDHRSPREGPADKPHTHTAEIWVRVGVLQKSPARVSRSEKSDDRLFMIYARFEN